MSWSFVRSGCESVGRRRGQVTTRSDPAQQTAPNLLERQFSVAEPNRVWVTVLTYCWDNAVVKSFFATLKRGLVDRQQWHSRRELKRELARYIDQWYDPE